MTNDEPISRSDAQGGRAVGRPAVLAWCDIRQPGCYLHLPSGLLARVFTTEAAALNQGSGPRGGTAVQLDPDPATPVSVLREIAGRLSLPVAF